VAIGSPHDRVLIGRYSPPRLIRDAREEPGLKSSEEVMEILEAFDLTGTLRDAAELAGCDHKTVAHWVRARDEAGGGLPLPSRPRPQVLSAAVIRHGGAVRGRHGLGSTTERVTTEVGVEGSPWAGTVPGQGFAVQSSAGRPAVRMRWWSALPAAARLASAWSSRRAGVLRLSRSRSWVRVSPSGDRRSAAWSCLAIGSPVSGSSAQEAERAA
jgi:hypothetical protein